MSRIWVVARWELVSTVARWSFILTAIALPAVHLGLAALIGISMRTATDRGGEKPVLLVDASGAMQPITRGTDQIVLVEKAALDALQNKAAAAVFILPADFRRSGRVDAYRATAPGLLGMAEAMDYQARAEALVRDGLLADRLAPSDRARVVAPFETIARFHFAGGRVVPTPASPLAVLGGVFGLSLLLSLAIFFTSGFLQQAMVEERQNRMLEVILTAITPRELLAGKLIGLSAAGLLQVGVYIIAVLMPLPAMLAMEGVSVGVVMQALACFVAGYVLYACVMAVVGTLGRDAQQSAQIAMICGLIGAAPLFLITSISAAPSSVLATALSWIPFTAPVTLLLRLPSGVGWLELTASLALTFAAAGLLLQVASVLLARFASGREVWM
jgi:ABC-2 type transport system permease protein